jgi:hypothetical protein
VIETSVGPDAVSTLLMTKTLQEEIHIETSLAASTQWIVSFPTRHSYVQRQGSSLRPPFGGTLRQGKACQRVEWRAWNSDGKLAYPIGPDIVFIGAGRCGLELCNQTQALQVEESDDYPFVEPPPPCYFQGSGTQELTLLPLHGLEGGKGLGQLYFGVREVEDPVVPLHLVSGLPAVGVSVSKFTNANVRPGVLGTFNTTAPLRSP